MENKKRVGIWIRVSTGYQVEDESPENHEKRGRMYADLKDWDVIEIYQIDAVSGKSVMDLPQTKQMLRDIKSGRITGLIFSNIARLARNLRELLDFADIFRDAGADLISLSESIDTSSATGRLFYNFIGALAQWVRENTSELVAKGVPARAELGKPLGGQAPFGYKWEGRNFLIDEKEAPVRALMYELFLKYKRKKTVARELNNMGYRSRKGTKFSDTTVGRLLRDSTAKGERRANYTKSMGDNKKWVLKPESQWIIKPCPAIVSIDLWNQCNEILDEQGKKRHRPGPRPQHLLAGLITCHCGKKMYVFHASPVYTCKACKNRIAVADIDEIYHEQLKSFLFTDADLQTYMEKTDIIMSEKASLLTTAKGQVTKLKKEMNELVEMRINKEISSDAFRSHYSPLEEQLKQLQEKMPELEAEVDFLKIQQLSSDTVLQEGKVLYNEWPNMPFDEKRTIIELITEKIEVGKEDITISLAYLPTNSNHKQKGGIKQRNRMDSSQQST